jgi:hypothetical protein
MLRTYQYWIVLRKRGITINLDASAPQLPR